MLYIDLYCKSPPFFKTGASGGFAARLPPGLGSAPMIYESLGRLAAPGILRIKLNGSGWRHRTPSRR